MKKRDYKPTQVVGENLELRKLINTKFLIDLKNNLKVKKLEVVGLIFDIDGEYTNHVNNKIALHHRDFINLKDNKLIVDVPAPEYLNPVLNTLDDNLKNNDIEELDSIKKIHELANMKNGYFTNEELLQKIDDICDELLGRD